MAMDEEGADIKQVANFAILAGDWQPEVGATFTTEAGETYRVQRVGEVRQTGLASFYDIEGIRP